MAREEHDEVVEQDREQDRRRARGGWVLACGLTAGVLVSGALVWQSSYAAFTSTTANHGNDFTSGSVRLSDDRSGTSSVMFTSADGLLTPNSTPRKRCITVKYEGTVAATVTLHGTSRSPSPALDEYLNLVVEVLPATAPPSGGTCDSTVSGTTQLYTGTLKNFMTSHSNHAAGLDSWSVNTTGLTRTYRFTTSLQDDNNAQGRSATADFTWSALQS